MSHSLDGKVAVVTGGTQGIGFAIAKEFVEQGATVVVTGRDQGGSTKPSRRSGQQASGVRADAGSPAAMDALLKDVKARYGRLDVVVANAVVDDSRAPREDHGGAVRHDDRHEPEGRAVRGPVGGAAHVQRRFDHPHRLDRFRGAAGGDEHLRRHQGGLPRHGPRPHPGSQGHGCPHQHPESRERSTRRRSGEPSARRRAPKRWTRSSSRWRRGARSGGSERRARSARSRCSSRATRQATSMASNCLSMAG